MIRATLQVISAAVLITTACALVAAAEQKYPYLIWLTLVVPVLAGFVAGARVKEPAKKGAIAGALGWFGLAACDLYRNQVDSIPCGGMGSAIFMTLLGAFGGAIAGSVLPEPKSIAKTDLESQQPLPKNDEIRPTLISLSV